MADENINQESNDITVLTTVLAALRSLDSEKQRRVLESVATFLGFPRATVSASTMGVSAGGRGSSEVLGSSFSEDRSSSPKAFLAEKRPKTDVHRVTCLAYYLTHFRDTPHFKTIDISKLNTEAAQPKFSNAAVAVDNATKYGYLVAAVKGTKQMSSMGESFVQALPDHAAAKEVTASRKVRKKVKRSTLRKEAESQEENKE